MKTVTMETNNNIGWKQIVNAILQAIIAALTALGVASCSLL